ncbi:hypothetical protein ACTXT7_011420 [Hymenolepis weldensis]
MEKSIEEMIGGYVPTDPTEVLPVMRTNFPPTVMLFGISSEGLGVNADADIDAYVETLQISVVKLPWTNSVVNGGRLHVFQQDPGLHGREFTLSCHTKILMAF